MIMVLLPTLVEVTNTAQDWLALGARLPEPEPTTVPLPLWKAAVKV